MLSFLPGPIKGTLILLIVITQTLFFLPFLLFASLVKLVFPIPFLKKWMTKFAIGVATTWVAINSALFPLFHKIKWIVTGTEVLSMDEWYLVNCNHQSWADIPVVQKVLNRKVPMLKFFLKQELIWVPILGICWWALDFPFMKRYSPQQVAKNPSLAGKDLETTRKACEKFKFTPVSIFNFLEGTRLTPEKHAKQASPFRHLLKPKAGGAAFVLGSMGDQLNKMLDISIIYPHSRSNIWDLLCGKVPTVVADIRVINIPPQFLGKDYANDAAFKAEFQAWLNTLWEEKDKHLEDLKQSYV
jgi:1-acyl-sn-glycerol-3-phosphate acyltransferase